MKFLIRAIDRFCYNHPRFGIRNLMLYIVIGNILVYLFSMMDTTGIFMSYLSFSPAMILKGQIWRLFTFVFIPTASGLLWVAISLYFYYFIGSTLEQAWGTGKFTLFYLGGVLCTIVYGIVIWLCTDYAIIGLDAAYLNLSMFFAFAILFPDMQVLLFFIIPIKIKWLAILDAVFFAFGIIFGQFPFNLLPLVAIFNVFIFCWDMFLDFFRRNRRLGSKNTIHFKTAVKRAEHEEENKTYRHKCAVCGRTDTEYPELEFRYCSQCDGYHCFCADHINNHIHFKE